MNEQIKAAIKLLNENDYVVVPINKGQMCLCDNCTQIEEECKYNSIGHACANLMCINQYIKEQLDYKAVIDSVN